MWKLLSSTTMKKQILLLEKKEMVQLLESQGANTLLLEVDMEGYKLVQAWQKVNLGKHCCAVIEVRSVISAVYFLIFFEILYV